MLPTQPKLLSAHVNGIVAPPNSHGGVKLTFKNDCFELVLQLISR